MEERTLISDAGLINQLIGQFTLIEVLNGGWDQIYVDNTTGVKWLRYRVNGELHGGGYDVLSKMPLPNTQQLINIVITSKYSDEVFAASRTLIDQEKLMSFRLELITALEQSTNIKMLAKIVEWTELTSALNRREILGKTIHEIKEDAMFYQNISTRAKAFLQTR